MTLQMIFKPVQPFRLISLIATYALGAGLLQYVETFYSAPLMVQGGIFLVCFVLVLDYLRAMRSLNDFRVWPAGMTIKEQQQIRLFYGLIAASFMTAATTLIVGWMIKGIFWQGLLFLIVVTSLLGGFYYLLAEWKVLKPYQIFIETLLVIVIPPALAYFIQSDRSHPFLMMVALPLIPIYIAYLLLFQLSNYTQDQKLGRQTMVLFVGWERAMVIHNILILLAFGIFALMGLLGFPWFLMWPVFLVLPLGLLEIWLMERVRQGGKPLWRIMKFVTASVLIIPVYLLGFAFWTR